MNLKIGEYYQLKTDKFYFSVDLQRKVRFNTPVIVKLTNFYAENRCFGNLVDCGDIKGSTIDYDTKNSIEFGRDDVIDKYIFQDTLFAFKFWMDPWTEM